jgi:hypothetical protein
MKAAGLWLKKEIHPLAWAALLGLDVIWGFAEASSTLTAAGVLLLPVSLGLLLCMVLGSVALVQHYQAGDDWQPALLKGLGIGVIAAVPTALSSVLLGAIYAGFDYQIGRKYTYPFAQIGGAYRELQRIVNRAVPNGSRATLESSIRRLQAAGKLSPGEAVELERLCSGWNQAHQAEQADNLTPLVHLAQELSLRYRNRF